MIKQEWDSPSGASNSDFSILGQPLIQLISQYALILYEMNFNFEPTIPYKFWLRDEFRTKCNINLDYVYLKGSDLQEIVNLNIYIIFSLIPPRHFEINSFDIRTDKQTSDPKKRFLFPFEMRNPKNKWRRVNEKLINILYLQLFVMYVYLFTFIF